jgi:hypothetical protein
MAGAIGSPEVGIEFMIVVVGVCKFRVCTYFHTLYNTFATIDETVTGRTKGITCHEILFLICPP